MKRWGLALAIIVGLSTVASARPVQAAVAASAPTQTLSFPLAFQTSGQSLWHAGAANDLNFSQRLIGTNWNVSGSLDAIAHPAIGDFGASVTASSSGAVGLTASLNIHAGSVSMRYPVTVDLTVPAPRSFRPGDTVTIGSHWTPPAANDPNFSFNTTTPTANLSMLGNFSFNASATATICVFVCVKNLSLIPGGDISLLPNNGNDISLASFTLGNASYPIPTTQYGVTGTVGGPFVTTDQVTVDAGTGVVNATGTSRLIDLTIFPLKMLNHFGWIPPLSFRTSVGGASVDATLAESQANLGVSSTHSFNMTPAVQVSLQLPNGVSVPFVVHDSGGAQVSGGTGNVITFDANNSVDFTFPAALGSTLLIAPNFSLNNTFAPSSSTILSVGPLTATAARFGMNIPETCILVITKICFGPVDVGTLGPLYSYTSPQFSTNFGGAFDPQLGTWQLSGFNTVTPATPIQLEPKHPLTVTANNASRLYGGANPPFTGTVTGFDPGDAGWITANFSSTAGAGAPVGTYPITLAGLNDPLGKLPGYYIIEHDGTLTVNPAPLTVTADDQTRQYGTPNPALTATLAGFVNGETSATSDVTGQASCATSAVQTSGVVGSPYAISCSQGTLTSRNYYLAAFRSGALHVIRAGTRTTLTTSLNPSVAGQPVDFQATAQTTAPGGIDPLGTGTVSLYDGSSLIGTAPLDSAGHARFTISSLTAGHRTITAAFSGDANYAPSTSNPITQAVRHNRIAFASTRDWASEIYLMQADGSGQTRLTRDYGLDTQPALSPDGTRIAFVTA
ncbi:MAG: Ig-like domain repeat protein, partial [Candidatus Dormibacteraeota bacterium]|nr:Ig-like domain repeat protein [Candidatus Dormibacteraeota bacterium]